MLRRLAPSSKSARVKKTSSAAGLVLLQQVAAVDEEQTVVNGVSAAPVSGRSRAVDFWRRRVAWVYCLRIAGVEEE